jgi:two-component system chemotaxis sensor kinase CheA
MTIRVIFEFYLISSFRLSDITVVDDFELEIKREFVNEALMNLEEVESSFMELEAAEDKKPLLEKIFRLAHNLKGGARAVGFSDVAEFTHQLESLVLKIQKGEVSLEVTLITVLLRANDRLIEMLSALKDNFEVKFNNTDLIGELGNWIAGEKRPKPENETDSLAPEVGRTELTPEPGHSFDDRTKSEEEFPPKMDEFFAEVDEASTQVESTSTINHVPLPQLVSPEPTQGPPTSGASPSSGRDELVRVSLSRIDLLNDLVGELIVLQSVVAQQASTLDSQKVNASIRQVSKLSRDIQRLTMGLRMLPVKPLVQKLSRTVRDTAQLLNKKVNMTVEGESLEIDKSVLDQLSDPLIHILRNAVDHGLELPHERSSIGKPESGLVTLNLANQGNNLVIRVQDDGKGIQSETLQRKAIEKGIIRSHDQLTDKQILHLIFHPGFSTKNETSEISGRGVGMDVVKTNIEKMGGVVEVTSVVGQGSSFELKIPLTLAVIEGLVVRIEKGRYVVPLTQVRETLNLGMLSSLEEKSGIGWCFQLRGQVIPLVFLDEALGSKRQSEKVQGTALIVNVNEHPIALGVSEIVKSQQVVIKPLGHGLVPQKGWVGTCVLGDGLPTLILNPIELLSHRAARVMEKSIFQRGVA